MMWCLLWPTPTTSCAFGGLLPTRTGYTLSFSVGTTEGTLTTATDPDGHLHDVFLRVGKQGSTTAGLADALATTVTVALHHGVPLSALTNELTNTHYAPAGPTNDPDLPQATSLTDYLSRRLTTDFPPHPAAPPTSAPASQLALPQPTPWR
jgi:ribonucleoside-diphosphate reductase alpha chain